MLTLVAAALLQQPVDTRGDIDLGSIEGVGVNPNGDLWVLSDDRSAHVSRDRMVTWSQAALPAPAGGRDDLRHIDFLDERHGVISGTIGAGWGAVLRTQDAGVTWAHVTLPRPTLSNSDSLFASVSDTSVDSEGNLWFVVNTGHLLVSRDRGATFEIIARPFDSTPPGSVCFETPRRGVISVENGARLTEDGGASWRDLAPLRGWSDLTLVGDLVLAVDCPSVHTLRLSEGETWRPAPEFEGHPLRYAVHVTDGFVGVLENESWVRFTPDLEVRDVSTLAPDAFFQHFAAASRGRLFAADRGGRVALLDEHGLDTTYMFSSHTAARWPLRSFDAANTDTWFGSGRHGFYVSRDAGKSWQLRAEAESFGQVWAHANASGAIVQRDGRLAQWSEREAKLEDIAALASLNLHASILRRGRLWVAYGSHEDRMKSGLPRSPHSVLVGDAFTAQIFASGDDGRTWVRVFEAEKCTIRAALLGDDDVLSLLLTDAHVVRIPLQVEDSGSQSAHVVVNDEAILRSQSQQFLTAEALRAFTVGERGSFGRPFESDTPDSRTSPTSDRTHEPIRQSFHRLGGGLWTRVTTRQQPPDRVELWRAGEYQLVREFDVEIHDARVDGLGRLLVRLDDSRVWALSPDAAKWEQLADQRFPEH